MVWKFHMFGFKTHMMLRYNMKKAPSHFLSENDTLTLS